VRHGKATFFIFAFDSSARPPYTPALADALSATKNGETIETKEFFASFVLFDIVMKEGERGRR
jgi:hypothetical protein